MQNAIYGLVQTVRQFWKKIVDKMQEGGGFQLSEADPCMLYREDERGVCIIIIYIDDMLIIGREEAIDAAIKVLQGHFQVKNPTCLEDFLGVQIVQSDDGKKAWLGQPTIIKSLEKQFGERVAKKKRTITPGTPGFIGGKVDDISKVDEKTQSMYRSGVGTLLYLTKHSRPDITKLPQRTSSTPLMQYLKNSLDTRQIEDGFSNSKSIKGYRSSYSLPDPEQHESSYNLLTQWDPGEKPLPPPLFRKESTSAKTKAVTEFSQQNWVYPNP